MLAKKGILPGIIISALLISYLFLTVIVRFNVFVSDVSGYWNDSLNLITPFHKNHVPLYPIIISIVRFLTFNIFQPTLLMQVITIITFLISCYLFFSTLNIEGISSEISAVGTLAFALFPFVGVTYVLFPVADLPAIMFYLAGLYTYKKKRFLISSIMFGCALITHKALWPVIGLFYLFQLVDILKKHGNMARFSIYLVCSFLPLLILWISGALYYSSLNWIISSNVAGEMATKSSLPVFDGIIGTIMQGGIKEISKGIFLLLLFILSIVLLVYGIKYKINDFLYLGYPIVLSIIALGIILNQSEIWAIVRFGRLLVLPLFLVISKTYFVNNIFSKRIFTNVVLPVLFISLLTNFFYIWYLQIYYQ